MAEAAGLQIHANDLIFLLCPASVAPESLVLWPNNDFISQTSFHIFFFLTKSITTLFWEVEVVSIFRKSKCQKSSEKHNWEVKNCWCDQDKYQITNIWNSSPSGPWGEQCLCLLHWLTDDLAFVVSCRMLDGQEKPEEGQIFVKCLLGVRHSARC